ncbi:transcriptional regulator ATRX homolog [Teleopsis dalmanni]|uniref:transcriptional regulator ATRX homolog n=1 Tax=Teleopsis dalmanni TaxID=139649 RepID=UPI0018CFA050|nr:transcriptional regulator ATRX homolog [Teleopsis dalmanni]
MGASSSIPETITVENPNPPPPPMQLTEEVIHRITDLNDDKKEERLRRTEPLRRRSRSSLYEKMSDLEEIQFRETYKKLEEKINKPMFWAGKVRNQIDEMRAELIKCNKENPHQSLVCNDIAERYQNFVFNEFYKSIQEQRPATKPNFHLVDIHKLDGEEDQLNADDETVADSESEDKNQSENEKVDEKVDGDPKPEEESEKEDKNEKENKSEKEDKSESEAKSSDESVAKDGQKVEKEVTEKTDATEKQDNAPKSDDASKQ